MAEALALSLLGALIGAGLALACGSEHSVLRLQRRRGLEHRASLRAEGRSRRGGGGVCSVVGVSQQRTALHPGTARADSSGPARALTDRVTKGYRACDSKITHRE